MDLGLTPQVPVSPLMTVEDFTDRLAAVGLTPGDVARGEVRLDVAHAADGPTLMVLVVTTYARNATGERYIDTYTREAAREVRRFFITEDLHLIPCSE